MYAVRVYVTGIGVIVTSKGVEMREWNEFPTGRLSFLVVILYYKSC